jgi:phosphate transport system protein
LPRLMDIGLERLRNMVLDMAELSQNTVSTAIDAFVQGRDLRERIYGWSEELRMLQDEVSELAVEIIARYQPVATDLRFVKSCMEVAYGFSRFGRYAHDISDVMGIFGDLSACNREAIEEAGAQAKDMIRISIKSFTERDVELAGKLKKMDDVVDGIYLDFVKKSAYEREANLRCVVSGTLILRYLERIADHATYVGETVAYIVSGERSARK